jgi:hypothetical protein
MESTIALIAVVYDVMSVTSPDTNCALYSSIKCQKGTICESVFAHSCSRNSVRSDNLSISVPHLVSMPTAALVLLTSITGPCH